MLLGLVSLSITLFLPTVAGVEFLPPEKSRLIKPLLKLRLEYLTHS